VDQTSAISVGCTTAAKDRQGCAESTALSGREDKTQVAESVALIAELGLSVESIVMIKLC
jgi:hypothetical protein